MSERRGKASGEQGPILRLVRDIRPSGRPVVHNSLRTAKLAALPVAYAGRQAAGAGRRAMGRSATDVNRDIQTRTAQHIFEVLGELRGCATKLGQILSLYELALPPELAAPYHTALAQLQDSAPAMLPRAVHHVMAEAMGRDWRSQFRDFDDTRPRAASIGQVHRAVWHDGRTVAVKVQYPGARRAMESDLRRLRRISSLFGVWLPGADIPPVTDEICARILEEVDYGREAANQSAFAAAFAEDPEFLVPRVVAHEDTVLISEWIGGTALTKVIDWGGPQPEKDRIANQIVRFCMVSPHRSGLLYGDPHPGNFRVLPDGRLGVLDFGACPPLPGDFGERALALLDGLLNGGLPELEATIRTLGFVRPGRDFDVVALDSALEPYRQAFLDPQFRVTPRWLRRRVLESSDLRLTNAYRQLTMEADLAAFGRMYLSVAGMLAHLNAHISLPAATGLLLPGFADVYARTQHLRNDP